MTDKHELGVCPICQSEDTCGYGFDNFEEAQYTVTQFYCCNECHAMWRSKYRFVEHCDITACEKDE